MNKKKRSAQCQHKPQGEPLINQRHSFWNSMYINCVLYKNNDTPTHTSQHGKHIWGLSNFFWQCILHHTARVRRYTWAMWCPCACVWSLSRALGGRDSRTRVCGKHRWLLLLLLPPDLCDLLHKDNRAVSYPQDPPPKKQQVLAAQTDHFLPSSCLIEQYQQPALRPPLCVSTRLLLWNN